MKSKPVTYDTVRRLALTLPNVEESTSYGTAALKVKDKLMVRLHDDGDKIVLAMPFDRREEMMEADPKTYFITDHYRDYPWILVSLARVREDALPDLLQIAYNVASRPRKRRV
ncbi:MAG TPA: MmcQ/YjbR family DNA-binding protein [Candidatus Solibacter sp.]|nr:MmcQ/YjbR family DNA-binding protein [Candidatus Solibacter sp.]